MKNFKFLAVALSAMLILSGCGNMNNTTKGGLLGGGGGAALGALAGYLIGKDAKGAAIGAAVGGAVGTGAGVIIGKRKLTGKIITFDRPSADKLCPLLLQEGIENTYSVHEVIAVINLITETEKSKGSA